MPESQQRYRVVEKLESGGMAEVFRAESEGLQGFRKQVAIKRVLPHLSEKKRFISMFLDEARLSALLTHSNCVQVFDIGVGDNAYFIVMEFVDGANLKSVVDSIRRNGKEFPIAAASFIGHEMCKGLSYAHELSDPNGERLNIVHRDVSPPNVLLTKFGEIKIVDFGLAKATSQLERSEPGIIKGKFSYLSPEAAFGQEVDARTDVFAVGIILWELLAGQRLFLGETDYQTVRKVQQAVVPPLTQLNPAVPPELERIINHALARDPAARFQTARELGIELSKFLFEYGIPVSTFDIAHLVQAAMRDKQATRPKQTSLIDKLIEEALLEFTSLTDGSKSGQSKDGARPNGGDFAGSEPLTGQFVDPTNWAKEISIAEPPRRADPLRSTLPPQVFDVGNLAALEDVDIGNLPENPVPTGLGPPSSPRSPRGPDEPLVPSSSTYEPALAPTSTSVVAKVVGVSLTVLAVLMVAMAWFFGIIPHK